MAVGTIGIIVLITMYLNVVRGNGQRLQGPVFAMEPPANLVFSNMTGSQVSCSAHGTPTPQVDWLLQDGSHVTAVPGLRQTLGNGTLYFPPFRAQDYRKDVHLTTYRCRASNQIGTIVSRDVAVNAIVKQHYEIKVYRSHVFTGNTAVLVCIIPEFVKDYVTVSSWYRDDGVLLPGRSDAGGRYLVTLTTGNLHIRSARMEDGASRYSCMTVHSLTHERKRSAPAILTVTEATGSIPPRLTVRLSGSVSVERGSDVHLSCAAQGNPIPSFTWLREINGQLEPIVSTIRISPAQDILYIRRVEPEDAGSWICKATNEFGEQRFDTQLIVIAHLDVHVLPKIQVVNSGQSTTFNCSVTGSPVGSMQWLRNGEAITSKNKENIIFSKANEENNVSHQLFSPFMLQIRDVSRQHRGMYQCIVRNDRESAQATAELRLGDTIPELQYVFIEQSLTPGPYVSLRCSASGSPHPQFRWFLDGKIISEVTASHRFAVGQYMDHSGDVVSHLNITNVHVEDGGLYMCKAVNSLGEAAHMARLNIYGPPSIRTIGPIRAVAGTDVTLLCPYSGFPISSVKWERRGKELPMDMRHQNTDSQLKGAFIIQKADPTTHSGIYKCVVTSRIGEVVQREIQLIVNSPPILEPFTFPNNLQEGRRAQVSCSVTSGDMPIQFYWLKDGLLLSPSLQIEEKTEEFFSILVFKEVNSRHSGSYTCVAKNNAATVNYTAQLMVKVVPQWVIEPEDVTTLLGNSVAIHCEAKGYPIPELTWLREKGQRSTEFQSLIHTDNHVQLLNNGTILIKSIESDDEGNYICRATNGIGSGLNKQIYISVNEPVRFETTFKNISAKRGEQAVLNCDALGDHPIQISWTKNSNNLDLSGYGISITEMNSEKGIISKLTIARTDRHHSGTYKCTAINTFGKSQLVINLAVQERPDPPTNVEVVEIGSRFVRLTWNRAFDGNSPLQEYLFQYTILPIDSIYQENWDQAIQTEKTFNLSLAITSNSIYNENENQDSAVVSGLLPATTYSIQLLAMNNIDQSFFSEPPVVVKTQEEAPIEAPQNVQVETGGPGDLLISWQIPPKHTWNGELLGYIITWNEIGVQSNSSKSLTVKGWATTKAQLTGLRKFNRYDITIRAFNSVSAGPQSVSVIGTTLEGVPEAAPQNIVCSQISSQSMKISWAPPPSSQHGGLIKGYKIFYRPVSSTNFEYPIVGEVKRTASSETYLHTLHKFTNYSIRVLAFTGTGDGALSSPIYCTTEEDVPGPPASIKAATLTGDSILVSWLRPNKPNGHIILYTVYSKEAGRSGKHVSHIVRTEGFNSSNILHTLMYEVRGLNENQLYEFWVSATTAVGEGETSYSVSQATNTRAPARIASFSQVLHKPIKSQILLPCFAIGNPTPRTRWLHRDKPITFSTFYEVTSAGFLNIHSADQSLAGNYTCSAKNLFGEDEITYTVLVLLPPGFPILEVDYSSSFSIRLKWNAPIDGGAGIQGYILHWKMDIDEWQQVELSPEMNTYTLENLKCGTIYHMFLTAYNRVGNGSPSSVLTIKTKGDKPQIIKQIDLLSTNATVAQINLYAWPDGGCPIIHFTVEYKKYEATKWSLVSNYIIGEIVTIQNLIPATWYQLKISAHNDAGFIEEIYNVATTTITGEQIAPPIFLEENLEETSERGYKKLYIAILIILGAIVFGLFILWLTVLRMKNCGLEEEIIPVEETANEKTVERDNRRNCQQIYKTSTSKKNEKFSNDSAEMYEISPYATFSVPGNGNRSVTTSTLDYTVQFKTFGHLENEDLNAKGFLIKPESKHSWGKHRNYNTNLDMSSVASNSVSIGGFSGSGLSSGRRLERLQRTCDSESDDTSDSPCNYCTASSAPTYRMPVKLNREDTFRPNSSTESNEISPTSERWQHTPRHLAVAVKIREPEIGQRDRIRDRNRPSSNSSLNKEDDLLEINTMTTGMQSSVRPLNQANSRDISETEYAREAPKSSKVRDYKRAAKTPTELVTLLSR